MGTAVVTRSRSMMTRLDSHDQEMGMTVTFVLAYEDSGLIYRTLLLNYRDWEALGSPEELTVDVSVKRDL